MYSCIPTKRLHIDLETYCSVDIKHGVYKYSESDDFEILLFAYAYGDDEPQVIQCARGEKIPDSIIADLSDPSVLKVAHNASFERVCLSRVFLPYGEFFDPEQWECTMVHAAMLGYPEALSKVGPAMGLEEQELKLASGTLLIHYFSQPCRPGGSNGGRTRNLPDDNPEKWNDFVKYNLRDVVTEMAIDKRLSGFPIPDRERKLYALDQRINDAGVGIDEDLVQKVQIFSRKHNQEYVEKFIDLTGKNPNSVPQVMEWMKGKGVDVPNLQKPTLTKRLSKGGLPVDVEEAIRIKLEVSKTSIKKYRVAEAACCKDGRMHGLFRFYGGRTGRWAGRLLQPQNLPRNAFDDVDTARELVKTGQWDRVEREYPSVNDVFATLIRTILVPSGPLFAVADFAAIEARVIAWLANETWRIEAFRNGEDIYCVSASKMFGVPVVKGGENGHLRKKGKIAELALGYGGGIAALKAFGASDEGMTEADMAETVKQWRAASPHIVNLWRAVDKAVKLTIRTGRTCRINDLLTFRMQGECLAIDLPVGRSLYYLKPGTKLKVIKKKKKEYFIGYIESKSGTWASSQSCIAPNRAEAWAEITGRIFDEGEEIIQTPKDLLVRTVEETYEVNEITFWGNDQTTHKYREIETYGAKIVENIVQAIARDCLAETLLRIEAAGYQTVMHVHDEVIVEAKEEKDLDDVLALMAAPIKWAPGLILKGAGFTGKYYRKD